MTTASTTSAAATTGSSTASQTGAAAMQSLDGNFQDFLSMLMTQLQNQDPTSPMDTDTFTQELVSFSGVEQQINTNTSLTQLINLTQSGEMLQGTSMVGHTVLVQSSTVPLQNSSSTVQFTAPSAENVQVAISTTSGVSLGTTTVQANAGSNTWTWNGQDSSGNTVPDGTYTLTITDPSGNSVPFNVEGTVTGVVKSNNSLDVTVDGQNYDMSTVQSLVN